MSAFFTKLISYLMIAYYTIIPTFSAAYTPYEKAADDVQLTVAMMSDTHLDYREYVLQGTFSYGLKHLKDIGQVDALLVDGDLTNYGDEKSIETFYKLVDKYSPTRNLIAVSGNHDIGHVEDAPHDVPRAYDIAHYNKFMGTNFEKIYYSVEMKGYKFIVLSDEGERWDRLTITPEQIAFLDKELADGTKDGKPVFVCCHWPMQGENGEPTVWEDSGLDDAEFHVKEVLKKYSNVFWISGHMHAGINGEEMNDMLGFCWAETSEDGVHYVTLPTYGLVNQYGIFWPGTGAVMEVYDDEVVFKGRSYLTGKEIYSSRTTFELV